MSTVEEFGHTKVGNFGSLIFGTILVYTKLDGKQDFKMTRPTFEYIAHLVRPFITRRDTRFRKAIPEEKRVAITLWKLATRNSYRSIGKNILLQNQRLFKLQTNFANVLQKWLLTS